MGFLVQIVILLSGSRSAIEVATKKGRTVQTGSDVDVRNFNPVMGMDVFFTSNHSQRSEKRNKLNLAVNAFHMLTAIPSTKEKKDDCF